MTTERGLGADAANRADATSRAYTIGVTGVTGNIGGAVGRLLASHGQGFRAIVRDAARVPDFAGAAAAAGRAGDVDVTVGVTEYSDARAGREALEGVDVLFMVSAAESTDRVAEHVQFIQSAIEAGVQHIVYTSFTGAGPDASFTLARDHGRTEEVIRASGLDFTFLRDNFYLDVLVAFADENGVIRGPAGDGRMAAVARADVADAAVTVLLAPGEHRGALYELTGGETLTFGELAERTTKATGRTVTFQNESVDEAYASRAKFNAPAFMVDAWVSTYTGIRDGELEAVSADVALLTGHAPRTLEDVLAGR
ncbi:SDR family oxidoreductase [Subtercola sp. RTI3]|uniref:SDR family oxidoreductase n=1 Tax=Subtercola sp. RTI3 TaxID=3048639 RepID=UPI002B2342B6|nr:SDR family oxidoreductase [Subtercola sp. RTI3]MEA9985003.1 SDR family oxidoreductase [Subtercola sp. RTI3]